MYAKFPDLTPERNTAERAMQVPRETLPMSDRRQTQTARETQTMPEQRQPQAPVPSPRSASKSESGLSSLLARFRADDLILIVVFLLLFNENKEDDYIVLLILAILFFS